MKSKALLVAGIIFSVVALLHLARLFSKFEVTMGSVSIPLWASVFGFIFASLLAFWMFASRR